MTGRAKRPLLIPLSVVGPLLLPGRSRSSIYAAATAGLIPTRRVGRRLLVPAVEAARLAGCSLKDLWEALEESATEDGGSN